MKKQNWKVLSLLAATLTISAGAAAGTIQEDPIAKLYQQKFNAAKVPSFEQMVKILDVIPVASYDTEVTHWMDCDHRSLIRGDFESIRVSFHMHRRTSEMIRSSSYQIGNIGGMNFFYNNGELQNLGINDIRADKNPTVSVKTMTFQTARVDLTGNLIVELSVATAPGLEIPEIETVSSTVKGYRAKVSGYAVCPLKNRL